MPTTAAARLAEECFRLLFIVSGVSDGFVMTVLLNGIGVLVGCDALKNGIACRRPGRIVACASWVCLCGINLFLAAYCLPKAVDTAGITANLVMNALTAIGYRSIGFSRPRSNNARNLAIQ